MASSFSSPTPHCVSDSATREADVSFAALPLMPPPRFRWTPHEMPKSVTRTLTSHSKKGNHPCSLGLGPVHRVTHKTPAPSPFVPGCVIGGPLASHVRQIASLRGVSFEAAGVTAQQSLPRAAQQVFVRPPMQQQQQQQQSRCPRLQLPLLLPNGVPLRRTSGSCFEHYRILESVGAGTYANVWKVQRRAVSRSRSNAFATTSAGSMQQQEATSTSPHYLPGSLYHCYNRSGIVSAEKQGRSATARCLPRNTREINATVSAANYQQICQQQSLAYNSCSSVCPLPQRRQGDRGRESPYESQVYAAKLLQLDRFSPDTLPRVREMFTKEIINLAACQCPGVVKLLEVVEGREGWLLVQNFVAGGTIWCEDVCRDEDEAFLYFIQVLQAVLYLQEKNILHRDLKPTNILRSAENKRVVIADFGWSERLERCRITPMEWPGTLEVNPPEIINGTGPLTDRLDNYAVGMTLLLFLSGRFVCRQKGLDAATAAPHVLRTVHELRRAPPPPVFRGSADAWALFIGLTAPHPSRRWSLEQVLSHRWVQRKLLLLDKKAFLWHPRVVQLAVSLHCVNEYIPWIRNSEIPRSNGLQGVTQSSSNASSSSLESAVKKHSGGDAALERDAVRWTLEKRYPAKTAFSTSQILKGGKMPTAAATALHWESAAGISSVDGAMIVRCEHSTNAGKPLCLECCRVAGLSSGKHVATPTLDTKSPSAALHQVVSIPKPNAAASRRPCEPQPLPSKGPQAESGGSRRQSMSICSTTDSFMTNISLQQQQHQASQRSVRGQLCMQTTCTPFTAASHAEKTAADGGNGQRLVSCNARQRFSTHDVKASQDSRNTRFFELCEMYAEEDSRNSSVPQKCGTYADNGEVISTGRLQWRPYKKVLQPATLKDELSRQLMHASEGTGELRERKSDEVEQTHAFTALEHDSGFFRGCRDNTLVPPTGDHCCGEQVGPHTYLQQQFSLLQQPFLTTSGEYVRFQEDAQDATAETKNTNNWNGTFLTNTPTAETLQSNKVESRRELGFDKPQKQDFAIVSKHEVSPFTEEESTAPYNPQKVPGDTRMPFSAFGKSPSLGRPACSRQQDRISLCNSKIDDSSNSICIFPDKTISSLLDERATEEHDHDGDSSWTVLHTGQYSQSAKFDPTVAPFSVQKALYHTATLNSNTTATVPSLQHADSSSQGPFAAAQPVPNGKDEHTWRHEISSFWNATQVHDNTLNAMLDHRRHEAAALDMLTRARTGRDGQKTALSSHCGARDSAEALLQSPLQPLLPVTASVSTANTRCPLFSKPSKVAVSPPPAVTKRAATASYPLSASHRFASLCRLQQETSTAALHRSRGAVQTAGNLETKSVWTGLIPDLHVAPLRSREKCALFELKENKSRNQRLDRRVHGGQKLPSSEPDSQVPLLMRVPAMRALPSALSLESSGSVCELATDFNSRRTIGKATSADATRGGSSPPLLFFPFSHDHPAAHPVERERVEFQNFDYESIPCPTAGATYTNSSGTAATEEAACSKVLQYLPGFDFAAERIRPKRTPSHKSNVTHERESTCLPAVCLDSVTTLRTRSTEPHRNIVEEKTTAKQLLPRSVSDPLATSPSLHLPLRPIQPLSLSQEVVSSRTDHHAQPSGDTILDDARPTCFFVKKVHNEEGLHPVQQALSKQLKGSTASQDIDRSKSAQRLSNAMKRSVRSERGEISENSVHFIYDAGASEVRGKSQGDREKSSNQSGGSILSPADCQPTIWKKASIKSASSCTTNSKAETSLITQTQGEKEETLENLKESPDSQQISNPVTAVPQVTSLSYCGSVDNAHQDNPTAMLAAANSDGASFLKRKLSESPQHLVDRLSSFSEKAQEALRCTSRFRQANNRRYMTVTGRLAFQDRPQSPPALQFSPLYSCDSAHRRRTPAEKDITEAEWNPLATQAPQERLSCDESSTQSRQAQTTESWGEGMSLVHGRAGKAFRGILASELSTQKAVNSSTKCWPLEERVVDDFPADYKAKREVAGQGDEMCLGSAGRDPLAAARSQAGTSVCNHAKESHPMLPGTVIKEKLWRSEEGLTCPKTRDTSPCVSATAELSVAEALLGRVDLPRQHVDKEISSKQNT